MPKVSVNIPVYNGKEYIRETLESVLKQTYSDFEIIIIDDGSTDETSQIIKEYNDPRIKYFFQENQGIGKARNAAIRKSGGEYIAFLDQDDLWLPDKLAEQITFIEKRSDLGLVFSDSIFFNEKKEEYRYYSKEKPYRGMVFRQLLNHYFISLETVVTRKKIAEEMGLFPNYMMAEE